MKNVYNEEKTLIKLRNKNGNVYLSHECYNVKFNMKKENGFWEQFEKQYFTTGKGSHSDVEKKWKLDHKNKEVKLISVTYI